MVGVGKVGLNAFLLQKIVQFFLKIELWRTELSIIV